MTAEIKFDRRPYTITYFDQEGKKQTIRRVPPPKLHNALPTDKIELTKNLSDDFKSGDSVTVTSINPRHPNTLKVENSAGQTSFVSHYDMFLKEQRSNMANSASPVQVPERNKYLLWP